jgi:hypothetical protein
VKKKKWSSKDYEKEREEFFKKQKGKCGICEKHQSLFKRRLNLDHNHKTLQIRGLLCYFCNKFVVGRHTYISALKLLNYLKIEVEGINEKKTP